MDLGIRHAATLKPAVEDLGDSPQHTLSTPWWDRQIVNAKKKKSVRKRQMSECQRHVDIFEALNSPQLHSAETGNWRCYDTDLKGQPPLPTTICNL